MAKGKAAIRRVKVEALRCTCQRCGHTWLTLHGPPRSCAACKARGWQQAARRYVRKRP